MTFHNGGAIEGTWINNILVGSERMLHTSRKCVMFLDNAADAAINHGDTEHNICCMACANTLVQDGSTVSDDQCLCTCVMLSPIFSFKGDCFHL